MKLELTDEEFSAFLKTYGGVEPIVIERWERYNEVVLKKVDWATDWEIDGWSIDRHGNIHVDSYSEERSRSADCSFIGLFIEHKFLYSAEDWETELERMSEKEMGELA